MTKAAPAQKLALTAPQTIPLDKLSIHDGNVRQIKAGISIENLAADIARRGLLQSLSVRPLIDEAGEETGRYGVQAGGRRLRALQMLVKQKKLAKNAPVPCIVRSEGFVEADSLAENTEREALHPIDQFRAFAALRDKGQGEDTIAAAFGVTPAVVKQRLRLANASPLLLKAYEDDEMSLEQLMAFCIVEDRKRQEEVWTSLKGHWNSGPDAIRRMLTEKTVRADDRRALFVGAEAYKEAGGIILRDLFAEDEDGWLQDVPLLEKLAGEKLTVEAGTIKAEGWGWVDAAIDFPWNHLRAYKPLKPVSPALSDEEAAEFEALSAEFEELDSTPDDELTAEAKDRLQAVKQLLAALREQIARLRRGAESQSRRLCQPARRRHSLDRARLYPARGRGRRAKYRRRCLRCRGSAMMPGSMVPDRPAPKTYPATTRTTMQHFPTG